MKKNVGIIVFLGLFSISAFSQVSELEISTIDSMSTYTSGFYSFTYPQGFIGIEDISEAFTAFKTVFDDIFRFDSVTQGTPCSVIILPDQTTFENYIVSRIGESRSNYVFLKYNKPELSELVLYPRKIDTLETALAYESFAGPNLNRQLFLQYLYSHIAEPPVWILDGFQSYFETVIWNSDTKTIENTNVYPWLETAKTFISNPEQKISISSLLSAVTGSYEAARFYPQAWAFTTFCVTTEHSEYQRFLHEAFMLLSTNYHYNFSSQQENTDAVKNRFAQYISLAEVEKNFTEWLSEKYTYNELIQFGVHLYNAGEYAAAKKRLLEAHEILPQDPLLSYYLGLVFYAQKDYKQAHKWYTDAGAQGAESSSVLWALALNAWAEESFIEAKEYLESVKLINPAKYGQRADSLLKSMPK